MGGFRWVSIAGAIQDDGHRTWVGYRAIQPTEVPASFCRFGLRVCGSMPIVSSSSQDFLSGKEGVSTMEPRLCQKQWTINDDIFYSILPPVSQGECPKRLLLGYERSSDMAPPLGMLKAGWFHVNEKKKQKIILSACCTGVITQAHHTTSSIKD